MFIRKITAGFFISTAAVLLLAQCSLCNVLPTPDEKSTEDDTSENSEQYSSGESAEVAFNEQVIQFAIKEVGAFSTKSLSAIKKFLESVTTDDAYDGAKDSDADSDYFKDFVLKIKKLEKDDNALSKFSLLDDIGYTLQYYRTHLDIWLIWRDVSDDIKVLVELFKKYNVKSLVSELQAITEDFKKTFKTKIYEFWQKLPAVERGSEKDFENWFKSFVDRKRLLYHTVLFEGIF